MRAAACLLDGRRGERVVINGSSLAKTSWAEKRGADSELAERECVHGFRAVLVPATGFLFLSGEAPVPCSCRRLVSAQVC